MTAKYSLSQRSRNYHGFTLVELLVTITILAILGTISIVSIQNFYGSARDSVRITDIQSLQGGLRIVLLKTGMYPLPENPLTIKADNNTILSYQWYLWELISRTININKNPLDPKDQTRYVYTVDRKQKKAELMGYLEEWDTIKNRMYGFLQDAGYTNDIGTYDLFAPAYASETGSIDYTKRFSYVAGDKIGVITDANNAPLQESTTATGVDLSTTDTSGYVANFGWDSYGAWKSTGTGDVLISQIVWALTSTIPCNPTTYSGYTIAALSHNETRTFTKPLTIANGSGTGSLQVACQNGVLDLDHAIQTQNVNCSPNFVNTGDNTCIPDVCGGSVPTNAFMLPGTTQSITKNWAQSPVAGICTFDCKTNYTYNLGTNTCNANTQTALACNGSIKSYAHDNSTATTWTQTWDGTTWLPVYTYTQNPTPAICTYTCDTGYTWDNTNQVCAINSYTVSWSFGTNANGATISVCGSNVTATSTGSFTATRNYGSVCNNITASRTGYTCTTTTNGPASLAANTTNVAGSCTDLTPPTITSITATTTANQIACNSVRFTINGASDTVALHASPYSFDSWSTWQAGNTKDYASTNQTIAVNQIKVRDAVGNIYTYGSSVNGTSSSCAVNGTCDNSTQFACLNGTTSVSNVVGSCGTNATWNCNGLNGGTNVSCFKANPTCPTLPTFTNLSNQSCNTTLVSNSAQINSIPTNTPISVSGGKYAISTDNSTWGAWINGVGTINSGNYVKLQAVESANGNTSTTVTLIVWGGATRSWVTTTGASGYWASGGSYWQSSGYWSTPAQVWVSSGYWEYTAKHWCVVASNNAYNDCMNFCSTSWQTVTTSYALCAGYCSSTNSSQVASCGSSADQVWVDTSHWTQPANIWVDTSHWVANPDVWTSPYGCN